MNGISSKDLYQIVDRAFSQWNRADDVSMSSEINIFTKKYEERFKSNPQIDVFEETPVIPQELKNVRTFLNDLEEYRQTLDVDSINDTLSEQTYRRLSIALDKYKNELSDENKVLGDIISSNVKRHLPEYEDFFMMKDLITEADSVYKRKPKKAQDFGSEECARSAYYLLKRILKNEKIKNLKPCSQKIELYQKSLKLVDCLTPKQYRRTFKFKLKRDINDEIYKCALELKSDYQNIAQEAKKESNKFSKAIVNTLDFSVRKYGEDIRFK